MESTIWIDEVRPRDILRFCLSYCITFLFFKKVIFELLRNARLISEEKKFILVIPEIFVIL